MSSSAWYNREIINLISRYIPQLSTHSSNTLHKVSFIVPRQRWSASCPFPQSNNINHPLVCILSIHFIHISNSFRYGETTTVYYMRLLFLLIFFFSYLVGPYSHPASPINIPPEPWWRSDRLGVNGLSSHRSHAIDTTYITSLFLQIRFGIYLISSVTFKMQIRWFTIIVQPNHDFVWNQTRSLGSHVPPSHCYRTQSIQTVTCWSLRSLQPEQWHSLGSFI